MSDYNKNILLKISKNLENCVELLDQEGAGRDSDMATELKQLPPLTSEEERKSGLVRTLATTISTGKTKLAREAQALQEKVLKDEDTNRYIGEFLGGSTLNNDFLIEKENAISYGTSLEALNYQIKKNNIYAEVYTLDTAHQILFPKHYEILENLRNDLENKNIVDMKLRRVKLINSKSDDFPSKVENILKNKEESSDYESLIYTPVKEEFDILNGILKELNINDIKTLKNAKDKIMEFKLKEDKVGDTLPFLTDNNLIYNLNILVPFIQEKYNKTVTSLDEAYKILFPLSYVKLEKIKEKIISLNIPLQNFKRSLRTSAAVNYYKFNKIIGDLSEDYLFDFNNIMKLKNKNSNNEYIIIPNFFKTYVLDPILEDKNTKIAQASAFYTNENFKTQTSHQGADQELERIRQRRINDRVALSSIKNERNLDTLMDSKAQEKVLTAEDTNRYLGEFLGGSRPHMNLKTSTAIPGHPLDVDYGTAKTRPKVDSMDKDQIIEILNQILKLWNQPVGVRLEEDGESTLYKTVMTTKEIFNKLPETVKTMNVFVPKKENIFYDIEKFKNGDFNSNHELLIDVNVSLKDIITKLEAKANQYIKSSYFRDRWWGSPLNLQTQIKSVLLKLRNKVTSVYYDQTEKTVILGGNSTSDKDYYSLYIKYKNKYLTLKKKINL